MGGGASNVMVGWFEELCNSYDDVAEKVPGPFEYPMISLRLSAQITSSITHTNMRRIEFSLCTPSTSQNLYFPCSSTKLCFSVLKSPTPNKSRPLTHVYSQQIDPSQAQGLSTDSVFAASAAEVER